MKVYWVLPVVSLLVLAMGCIGGGDDSNGVEPEPGPGPVQPGPGPEPGPEPDSGIEPEFPGYKITHKQEKSNFKEYSVTPTNSIPISTCEELQGMKDNLSTNYYLTNDIDCTDTVNWNGGLGFEPLGEDASGRIIECDPAFIGSLDGRGYTIKGLYISRPAERFVGLFRCIHTATESKTLTEPMETPQIYMIIHYPGEVKNLILSDFEINGNITVGALIGEFYGHMDSCSVSGYVEGNDGVGGLVGKVLHEGTVSNSASSAKVKGTENVGGLLGSSRGTVSKCSSTGTVEGNDYVGGLIGNAGGDKYDTISESFSSASVTGQNVVGGLTGSNSGWIANCYSSGPVSGNVSVGGLVGGGHYSGMIATSYSYGAVSGSSNTGGLYGICRDCNTRDSFWDTESTGQSESARDLSDSYGGEGKTTAEMQTKFTFTDAGWNFTHIWKMDGYPRLQWEN